MTQQKSNFQLVCDFNQTFDFPVYPLETNPFSTQVKSCQYRCDLIKEEGIVEFGQALSDNNLVEMLDAVCDHLYVLYGACYTFSLNPDINIKINSNSINTNNITKLIKTHFGLTNTITELYELNCDLEKKLRESMLETKNIIEVESILIDLIINTYNIGFQLTNRLDEAFLNVHKSNMSKLCKSIEEAEATVKDYQEKYNNGSSTYDTPYYYELKPSLYVVKNKSTGKALKSINYTPADLKQFL
jgi:predicted HAD superfamily Cof-like phosphohydrolase